MFSTQQKVALAVVICLVVVGVTLAVVLPLVINKRKAAAAASYSCLGAECSADVAGVYKTMDACKKECGYKGTVDINVNSTVDRDFSLYTIPGSCVYDPTNLNGCTLTMLESSQPILSGSHAYNSVVLGGAGWVSGNQLVGAYDMGDGQGLHVLYGPTTLPAQLEVYDTISIYNGTPDAAGLIAITTSNSQFAQNQPLTMSMYNSEVKGCCCPLDGQPSYDNVSSLECQMSFPGANFVPNKSCDAAGCGNWPSNVNYGGVGNMGRYSRKTAIELQALQATQAGN